MKQLIALTLSLLALAACAAPTEQPGLANPASVYCEENGYTLQIVTAEDGSQSGVCVFPDGSSCDEWAYFRGECGPAVADGNGGGAGADEPGSSVTPGTTEAISDWWGVIKSTEPGAQFDDYFERQDLGQVILFGIDASDPAVQEQIAALRDSGKIVHLYGTLFSNVPDVNGSQILVERLEVEE